MKATETNMNTDRKSRPVPIGLPLAFVAGFRALATSLVVGQSQQDRGANVLIKKRETVNRIPKEYGRLAGVDRFDDGTVLYFEAPDGTTRIVSLSLKQGWSGRFDQLAAYMA